MSIFDELEEYVPPVKATRTGKGGYEKDPYKRFQSKVRDQIKYINDIQDEFVVDKPARVKLWFEKDEDTGVYKYKVLRSGLHLKAGVEWYTTPNLDTLKAFYEKVIDAADNDEGFRKLLAERFASDAQLAAEKGLGKGRQPKKEGKAPKAKK
jgi:hypothetical protein